MIALTKYGNAHAAVIKLLRSLKISIDPEMIIGELDKHPDYPSLLAVSDVLTAFRVENVAFHIGFDELGDIPVPYLAHVKSNGGGMVLVKKIENGRYYLSSDKWNNRKVSFDEFKKMYNGIVLTTDP
ncbi:MAG TPA: cysteine peptidase family C39 domain-containing protein, partial [Mucilaginibacter sp.]|nr:cysteine peptidase family C39 domain-containing protein [Mucilaginibacter sp.]